MLSACLCFFSICLYSNRAFTAGRSILHSLVPDPRWTHPQLRSCPLNPSLRSTNRLIKNGRIILSETWSFPKLSSLLLLWRRLRSNWAARFSKASSAARPIPKHSNKWSKCECLTIYRSWFWDYLAIRSHYNQYHSWDNAGRKMIICAFGGSLSKKRVIILKLTHIISTGRAGQEGGKKKKIVSAVLCKHEIYHWYIRIQGEAFFAGDNKWVW